MLDIYGQNKWCIKIVILTAGEYRHTTFLVFIILKSDCLAITADIRLTSIELHLIYLS
mgnify:CR=1 FL=1